MLRFVARPGVFAMLRFVARLGVFACVLGAWLLAVTAASAGEVALTFDDVPAVDGHRFSGAQRTERLIEELRKAGVEQAAFFVVTGRLDDGNRERLAAYAKAGHLIGNHSQRHARAAEIGSEAFLADLQQSHRVLRSLPGFFPYFRFPYLNEGADSAMRRSLLRHLTDHGYEDAYVTVNVFDWHLETLFQQALAAGATIDYAALRHLYVDTIWQALVYFDRVATEQLGRSPRHILLLHENDLAALHIADLVEHLREQGWRIVSPAVAYQDPLRSTTPATLPEDRRRVAEIAIREDGRPFSVFEDKHWLEERFKSVVGN
jgi:peptidoglycan/xylan/chitin deacetylase (PgdA/CDA1 family)